MYNSVSFRAFTVLCHHHLCLVPETFITPKETLSPLAVTPHLTLPLLIQPRLCFLSL